MWSYSYTVLQMSKPIQMANLFKYLLNENSHLKPSKITKKFSYIYRGIKMIIYIYGKLQELET